MMRYLSYVAASTNPYKNLATEEYLSEFADKDTNILFLWQNHNTIVIGRNQDVENECRVEEFLKSGGKVARRRSGGGAVYHDLGNLNFSLIGEKKNINTLLYKDILIKAISGLGLCPEYSGRNDILVSGRKFSGNAVYDDGKIVCQHGTIMVDCNIEKMTYFLTPDKEKLEKHAVKSVSSRVINLKELVPKVAVEDIIGKMIEQLNAHPLSLAVDGRADELMKKYQSEEWIYGGVS